MKVYGVYVRHKYEGGHVLPDLYKSYKKAKVLAKEYISETENNLDISKFKKMDKQQAWTNGIDVVAITEFKVL